MFSQRFNHIKSKLPRNPLGHRKWSHQLLGLLLTGVAALMVAWMVSSMWNLTLVEIAGWPTVGIWQTLGILALIRILSWFVGYPARHASHGPLSGGHGAWLTEASDV